MDQYSVGDLRAIPEKTEIYVVLEGSGAVFKGFFMWCSKEKEVLLLRDVQECSPIWPWKRLPEARVESKSFRVKDIGHIEVMTEEKKMMKADAERRLQMLDSEETTLHSDKRYIVLEDIYNRLQVMWAYNKPEWNPTLGPRGNIQYKVVGYADTHAEILGILRGRGMLGDIRIQQANHDIGIVDRRGEGYVQRPGN